MTSARNQDNSAELSTALAAEGNPYLQSVPNEQPKPRTDGGSELDAEAQQEEAFHRAEEEKKRKRRRHRWIAITLILTLLSAVTAFAVIHYRPNSTTVEYRQAAKQPGVLSPPPNATTTPDNRHEQAILELQRLNKTWQSQNTQQQAATAGTNSQKAGNADGATTTGESQQPFIIPASSNGTHNASSSEKDSSTTSPVSATDQRSLRSQRNSETSLYVGERNHERVQQPPRSLESAMTKALAPKNESTATAVAAPPFGSILPVRAIGGLYTLRSGALARFEITRDMIGNGWSMKRGTILVGTTKGGEYDRAYVSVVGFIEPQSGKLVKLGGDVLGGDGAAGLKGKSRQVDSRWTRVLGQVGNAALNLTGAILGGRSNGTVIISDGARSPLINPISDELNGVLGSPSNGNRRTGFVEVGAGTPGYVIVTDLPAEIKTTDANELSQETLATVADIDSIRPATGISERELADLLANGSPDEIKARLHRMSPEMRKIALAVVER
jgi:hypothetical protein